MLTGLSSQSRNFTFGQLIGKGISSEAAKKQIGMVVEGIETVISTYKLAEKHKVDMPIVQKVYEVIFKGLSPSEAVKDLLNRKLKSETNENN